MTPQLRCGALLLAALVTLPAATASPALGPMDATAETATGPVDLKAAAAEVDRLVEAGLARARIMPNPGADDLTFARRASLDLIGRIPTYRELQAYLAWPRKERREKWIDQLIGSSGYVSHQYNRWADMLRIESRMQGRIPGEPYIEWVKQALRDNVPYDDMVRELLTGTGGLWEHGQTGYYLRDQGMNQDNMANTVQVFLGTRIQCAQCHDHPFEDWTQKQFYAMAAFTNQTRTGGPQASLPNLSRKDFQRINKGLPGEARQAIGRFLRNVAPGVAAPRAPVIKLPDTYQYADGEPGDRVDPHVLWGETPQWIKGQDPRQAMATWVTDPANPRFTTVIANRMWKSVMGLGLIEPVDDLRDDTEASNPELMTYLEDLMRRLDYDQQAFHRVLVMTDAYQRESDSPFGEDAYRFPGPVLRRMSAEQVWDSLMALTVPDVDQREGRGDTEAMEAFYLKLKDMDADQFAELARGMGQAAAEREKLQQQRRELLTKAEVAAKAGHPRVAEDLQKQAAEVGVQMRELARKYRDAAPMMNMRMQNNRAQRQRDPDPRWKGLRGDWVRASELQQSARAGHFLRNFGQSDRQTIDAQSTEGTVIQTLTLLNGVVDQMLLHPRSALVRDLGEASSPDQKIAILFMGILGREPTTQEWATARNLTQQDPRNMVADLSWGLVNTTEFLFVR